jgi:hypothetical protein
VIPENQERPRAPGNVNVFVRLDEAVQPTQI